MSGRGQRGAHVTHHVMGAHVMSWALGMGVTRHVMDVTHPGGQDAKRQLDKVLDVTSAMQNLREAIYDVPIRLRLQGARTPHLARTLF